MFALNARKAIKEKSNNTSERIPKREALEERQLIYKEFLKGKFNRRNTKKNDT